MDELLFYLGTPLPSQEVSPLPRSHDLLVKEKSQMLRAGDIILDQRCQECGSWEDLVAWVAVAGSRAVLDLLNLHEFSAPNSV